MSAYVYIWEFRVRAERAAEFEDAYGPEGRWVRLFRRAAGYESTVLLRDTADELRYLTIDRWRSEADYHEFRRVYDAEYRELDAHCDGLTLGERSLGGFEG